MKGNNRMTRRMWTGVAILAGISIVFTLSAALYPGTIHDAHTPDHIPIVRPEAKMLLDYYQDGMVGRQGMYVSNENGRFVIDTAYYEHHEFRRGDVVYAQVPGDRSAGEEPRTALGRIIALPGENAKIRKGQIYVDSRKLDTYYGRILQWGQDEKTYFRSINRPGWGWCDRACMRGMKRYFRMNVPEFMVPEGHLFVMGDTPSRSPFHEESGPLPLTHVLGKVIGAEGKPAPSGSFEVGGVAFQGEALRAGIAPITFTYRQPQEVILYLWGDREWSAADLVRVEALQTVNSTRKPVLMSEDGSLVWETSGIGGPLQGADASVPVRLVFDSPSIWRLDIRVNGELHASLFIEVQGQPRFERPALPFR